MNLLTKYLIVPNIDIIYVIWLFIIFITIAYNMFYIPLSLAFDYDNEGIYLIIDIFALIIYIMDNIIRYRIIYIGIFNSKKIKKFF